MPETIDAESWGRTLLSLVGVMIVSQLDADDARRCRERPVNPWLEISGTIEFDPWVPRWVGVGLMGDHEAIDAESWGKTLLSLVGATLEPEPEIQDARRSRERWVFTSLEMSEGDIAVV